MIQAVTTILADRHPIVLSGLQSCLLNDPSNSYHILATTDDGEQLIDLILRESPELVILDLDLSSADGLQVIKKARKESPETCLVVFSAHTSPDLAQKAKQHGANACIDKRVSAATLCETINATLTGADFLRVAINRPVSSRYPDRYMLKRRLTRREREILVLIADALSNKEIADQLYISDQTVGVHRKNIMRKLGVSNAAGLVRAVYDYQLW